jgi:hypothetical protein
MAETKGHYKGSIIDALQDITAACGHKSELLEPLAKLWVPKGYAAYCELA